MDSGAWRATVCGLERIEHDRETHTFTFQETGGIALSGWKIMHFLLINSGHFLSSAAFSWSNWEQYLELIIWVPCKLSKKKRKNLTVFPHVILYLKLT